jgi:hypothetical protein
LEQATGDTIDECDRGKCGALGEFTNNHPLLLLTLFVAGAAILAVALALLLGRPFRALNDRPERNTAAAKE